MSGLIDFHFGKYSDTKRTFNLIRALIELPPPYVDIKQLFRAQEASIAVKLEEWIQTVIQTVKQTIGTQYKTCGLTLKSNLLDLNQPLAISPPSCNPTNPHLMMVARALYGCYGIEIKQIDSMTVPRKLIVTWHRDHPQFFSSYLKKLKKEFGFNSCILKFKNRLFHIPRNILAAKSAYFETLFQSGYKESSSGEVIEIRLEGLEDSSVQKLCEYFITGELDLKGCSIRHIDDFVNFSSHYDLPYLEQICFEHLCQHVNIDNFETFATIANDYGHEKLKSALVEVVKKTFTLGNIEPFTLLACTTKIDALEEACLFWLKPFLNAIEMDITNGHLFLWEGYLHLNSVDYVEREKHVSDIGQPYVFGIPCRINRIFRLIKLLQLAVKCQSVRIVEACVDRMKNICCYPYYQTDLSKPLECLVVAYHYSSQLGWWPKERRNPMQDLKSALLHHIQSQISEHNIKLLLLAAVNEKIDELQDPCLNFIIAQVQKIGKEPSLFDNFEDVSPLASFVSLLEFFKICPSPQLFKATLSQMEKLCSQPHFEADFANLHCCLELFYSESSREWLPADLQMLRAQMIEKLSQMVVSVLSKTRCENDWNFDLEKAIIQHLGNGNPDWTNPSPLLPRIQRLNKLLQLSAEVHSEEILMTCLDSLETRRSDPHPNYPSYAMVFSDFTVVRAHYSSSSLTVETQERMDNLEFDLIEGLAPYASIDNVEWFWKTAIRCRWKTPELKEACLKILIPEVKKINDQASIWGNKESFNDGTLNDVKKLLFFIKQSQSVELTQAMIDHLQSGKFENTLPSRDFKEDWEGLDFCMEFAYSNLDLEEWPPNFVDFLSLFTDKLLTIAKDVLNFGYICTFDGGVFVKKCLSLAKEHHIEHLKEKCEKALIEAIPQDRNKIAALAAEFNLSTVQDALRNSS